MKQFLISNKTLLIIIFITVIGTLLRFYSLNWGSPFYFHPDERNIASSITQLSFPEQMNPHFFAYGSFPIYVIYFTGLIINLYANFNFLLSSSIFNLPSSIFDVSFDQTILISRFYSAFLSILLIPSLYYIGKQFFGKEIGIFTAFFTTFSVGFIQFAHFGTFEMWLTFFGVWLFYFCMKLIQSKQLTHGIFCGIVFGILISIKISSLVLLIIPLFVITGLFVKLRKNHISIQIIPFLKTFFLFIFCGMLIFLLTNIYAFLDFSGFKSALEYESKVALGTLPVFYTGGFFNTIPILFQFQYIFPFLLNPLLTFIFLPSFIYFIHVSFKKRIPFYLLLFSFFFILFLSQALLFAKWTRYMIPTLPFIYLIIAISLSHFLKYLKENKTIKNLNHYYTSILVVGTIIFSCLLFSISYFITVFTNKDSRVEASRWAKKNIPSDSRILSEVYDLGIIPFNQYFQNITLYNFYDLDPYSQTTHLDIVESYDYIILPSQRILRNRLKNPEKFPRGNMFYKQLLNGSLGFTKIYETPCDILCKFTYMGDPVFNVEETANVFDRPTVMMFKRN